MDRLGGLGLGHTVDLNKALAPSLLSCVFNTLVPKGRFREEGARETLGPGTRVLESED